MFNERSIVKLKTKSFTDEDGSDSDQEVLKPVKSLWKICMNADLNITWNEKVYNVQKHLKSLESRHFSIETPKRFLPTKVLWNPEPKKVLI